MGPRFLLLTTRGRRTGLARTVGLNYARDGHTVYVISGFGRTDWYRNLVADPGVEVQVGTERWRGLARPVLDPTERERAGRLFSDQAVGQGPPRAVRSLLGRLGLDYEAEVGRVRDPGLELPIVAIERPADPSSRA
jgi:deazaflavin-dependent oxidoreductase (nitroreductase family)